jgi:hypothetical protein
MLLAYLDLCLINQHYRDVVTNRVYPVTFDAFKSGAVRNEPYLFLTEGAGENFQKLFADSHKLLLAYLR